MAKSKYKVWLTVKDCYGNKKELDGGNIVLDLDTEDIDDIATAVKDNIAIDTKTPVYVPKVTPDNMLKFKLTDEITAEELEFDIDKSNDWNETDSTTGSSYVWEPMQ